MNSHVDRPHSPIGPSAAHRWIACPGSVRLSDGEPNHSSVYALEGTAAHQFVEHIMQTGDAPGIYEGGRVYLGKSGFIAKANSNAPEPNDFDVWEIDADMIEAASIYRDAIMEYIEPGDTYRYESKLDMSHVHPMLYGTGDCVIMKKSRKTIVVGDFKYGMGIAVEPEDNEQLLCYAIGQRRVYRHYDIQHVVLLIVQPRAFHRDGPVRAVKVPIAELDRFERRLKRLAALTDDPDAPLSAGEHCRFCPAAYRCAVLRKEVATILGVKDLRHIRYEADMPNPEKMSPADLARVMRGLPIVESFLRRVAEHAHRQALHGEVPPGMKVVARRQYRQITDGESIKFDLDLMGYEQEEYMAPAKLRGIGAIESLVGKAEFKKTFERYTIKKSTGFVLAPEDDPRPAVDPDNSKAFIPED